MIDLRPTSEQESIARSVASFFNGELPVSRLRASPGSKGPGPDKWPQVAELGLFGIGLDQDRGGVGYSIIEEVMVFREIGRYLISPQALGAVVGARVAAMSGDAALAQDILVGATRVGIAVGPRRLDGRLELERDLHLVEANSDWFVAWDDEIATLVPAAEFQDVTPLRSIDFFMPMARARLGQKPRLQVAASEDPIGRRATLLCAAIMTGLAEAARDDSVKYVNMRVQFGQPIGGFQAVKHRCSDMAARATAAWSQTLFAALAEREQLPDTLFQATAAVLVGCDAAIRNAASNVQNHGGMGYTREVEAHHYVKRAQIFDKIAGDMRHHRRVMLAQPAPDAADMGAAVAGKVADPVA